MSVLQPERQLHFPGEVTIGTLINSLKNETLIRVTYVEGGFRFGARALVEKIGIEKEDVVYIHATLSVAPTWPNEELGKFEVVMTVPIEDVPVPELVSF